jgi:putative DNA primase/helicase
MATRDTAALDEALIAAMAAANGGGLHLVAGHLPLTDMGNSERLVRDFGSDLRHVPAWGWLRWDQRRWVSKDVVRSIYREAADEQDKEVRKLLAAHARYSERKSAVTALVSLTMTVEGVAADPADFDADPWTLAVSNGTLDLRTGDLGPHRREDHITRLVKAEYDPCATSAVWEGFLDHVTAGKPGLREFLQRAAGYTLTGDVREEVLFTLHGPAGCGKTTFEESISGILGGYAGSIRIEALTDSGRGSGGHNEDVARLVGLRMVTAVEASEGDRLREGLVKSLTGGDTIAASRKNRPAFEFRPAFKLWMATNFVPRVRADDSGMQRRLVKLPFENRLTPGCVSGSSGGNLKHELRQPEVQRAILAWAVAGCLDWQRGGLNPPDCVKAATDDLWRQMDTLGQFFDECLVFGDEFRATAKQIRGAYDAWCDDEGIPDRFRVSERRMAEALRARGTDSRRSGAGKWWAGVGVLATEPAPDEPCEPSSRESGPLRATSNVPGFGSHGSQASSGVGRAPSERCEPKRGQDAATRNGQPTGQNDAQGSLGADEAPTRPDASRASPRREQGEL